MRSPRLSPAIWFSEAKGSSRRIGTQDRLAIPGASRRAVGFALTLALLLFGSCSDRGEDPARPDVEPPVVTLLSPNGGELLLVGSVQQIRWSAEDPDTPAEQLRVAIELLVDGGAALPIASGWENSGEYEWVVPNQVSSSARVRVTVSDGVRSASDQSEAGFVVLQPPPPGENLLAVGTVSGIAEATVEVTLSLANDNPISSLEGALTFDPSIVRFVEMSLLPRAGARKLSVDSAQSGTLRFAITAAGGTPAIAPGAGNLGLLRFELLPPGNRSTALTLGETVLHDDLSRTVDVTTQNGSITVGDSVTPPSLLALIPARTVIGDTVRVQGTEFGETAGAVRFASPAGTVDAVVLDWSPTEARVLVPDGAADGPVRVALGQAASNPIEFSVAPRLISFANDLSAPGKPLQRGGCQSCHFCFNGTGGSGDFCVNTVADVLRGGDHGPAVVPRQSAQSNLLRKLLPAPPFGDQMPPGSTLRTAEIQDIRDWIDQGARDN